MIAAVRSVHHLLRAKNAVLKFNLKQFNSCSRQPTSDLNDSKGVKDLASPQRLNTWDFPGVSWN